ncbi:response regulator [Yoonia sp. MH D7]
MSQRIMAIDDSDIAQEFIRSNLAELGFNNVISYLDPSEALEAIQNGHAEADLILLDIMMPKIDGIELCARIRGIDTWRDVPIIMLTSRKDMEALSSAFMAGANDFISKPFNRIELQARMKSCLRLKAELTRRRASERRRTGETLSSKDSPRTALARQDMLGSKSGFQADLMVLSAQTQGSVSLIALKVDNLKDEPDFATTQRSQIIKEVATILSKVSICAGDSFSHWEDDLFCFASLNLNEDALRARAETFVQSVQAAKLTASDAWRNAPVSISAIISPVGEGTIGNRLGNAFKMLEANAGETGTVKVLQS